MSLSATMAPRWKSVRSSPFDADFGMDIGSSAECAGLYALAPSRVRRTAGDVAMIGAHRADSMRVPSLAEVSS